MHNEEEEADDSFGEVLQRFEHMLKANDTYYFDADELEDLADYFVGRNDLANASKVLDLARQQHPHTKEFDLRRAELLIMDNRFKDALSIISVVEAIDPNNTDILVLKASVYSRTSDHQAAINLLFRALAEAEYKSGIRLLLAYEYQSLGANEKAIAELKHALLEDHENLDVLYELAFLYDTQGDMEGGIEFFKSFTDKHPYSDHAWFNLGVFYGRIGDLPNTIWALDLCVTIDDTHFLAHMELGDSYMLVEEWEMAEEHFNRARELDPDNSEPLIGLAECLEGRGLIAEAFAAYKHISEIDANAAEAWFGMAVIKERLEEFNLCFDLIDRAIEIDPNQSEYWVFLADLEAYHGNIGQADQAYGEAIRLNPDDLDAWCQLADLRFKFVDRNIGLETILEAVRLMPDQALLHFKCCAFLLEMGKEKDALVFLENGLELDHTQHEHLFDDCPDARTNTRVMELIGIYGQQ